MMVNLPCLMVSCTNFLRSTCSYTECQLSFLTGSCPTERTTVSYSSCLLVVQCISHSILVYGFPIQNPARFQILSGIQQGSGISNTERPRSFASCHICLIPSTPSTTSSSGNGATLSTSKQNAPSIFPNASLYSGK